MGRQTNILSFDEARRGIGTQRSSVSASGKPVKRYAPHESARQVPSTSARSSSASSPRTARTDKKFAPTHDDSPSRKDLTARQNRLDAEGRKDSRQRKSPPAKKRESVEKSSPLAEFRRERQKNRADKKFDKQFGGARAADASSSGGSRAAVYKGEMGSVHRRAARMQGDVSGSSSVSLRASWMSSPKLIVAAGIMACLVLSCWFLYTPAQQYYQSVREYDRLQAEYAAIEQRNVLLQVEVDALGTDAGLEDRARQEFGWVKEGEQTANVRGLAATEDSLSNLTVNIVPGSVEAPETWYSPMLDVLFGVES